MAESDTIKEFLIKLGYKVDAAAGKKFDNTIAEATKSVNALGLALDVSLAAVTAFTVKASEALDKLYFASQRTHSAVGDLQSMGYAVSQLGGSGDAALASMENLGHFIRSYPGAEDFLRKLGVDPSHTHDAAKSMEDLGRTFRKMPFWQAQPYANMLGIDEKTLLAMQSGELNRYLDEYKERLKGVGLNADDAAQKGNAFMTALRGMTAEANIAGEAFVSGPFGKGLIWVIEKLDAAAKGFAVLFTNPAKAGDNVAHAVGELAPQGTAFFKAKSYFEKQGWSAAQAAGIASNLQRESNFDPSAKGDNGQAYGVAQWHKSRRADFKSWAGHDIFGSSFEEQLAFINHELKNKEWKAAAQLRDAKTPAEAGARFSEFYERPADRIGEARLRGDLATKGASVSQTTTIQVTGSDPNAIATAVAARQNDVNNQLVRNVQGAVR